MSNNLKTLKKDLKAFAKRCKDFKYTDSALITFLLCKLLIVNNLFSAPKGDTSIENQIHLINSSINQLRTEFKQAKSKNNKLIKGTNLELIQLMEQGDHVVKSPWSSWQYGVNEFYADWHGTYRGNGTKNPGEQRKFARLLGTERYTQSYSNGKYGVTDIELVETAEPTSEIVVEAGIRPKSINKQPPVFNLPAITPPVLPTVNVNLSSPDPVTPPTPSINPTPPVIPVVNANPFSDFSYHWRPVKNDGTVSNNRTAEASVNAGNDFFNLVQNYSKIDGGTFWTGVDTDGNVGDVSGTIGVTNNGTALAVNSGTIKKDENNSVVLTIFNTTVTPKTSTEVAIGTDDKRTTVSGSITTSPSRTMNALNFGLSRSANGKAAISNINVYVAGGTALYDDNVNYMFDSSHKASTVYKKYTGGAAIHTVGGELTINNSTFNLYGKAAAVNMESWRSPKVDIQNSTINVKADNNTVFNLQGGTYYHEGLSAYGLGSKGEGSEYAGSISGKVDINVPTKGNTIYAIGGYSRGFKITNEGTVKLEGASNVVISDLGYVTNSKNYIGTTNAPAQAESSKNEYVPVLALKKHAEQYGDNNVTMFFNTQRNNSITNIGIYQGEVIARAKIGEYLDSNGSTASQTANGNEGDSKFVENNVGIFARSGQRTGITPTTNLGATFYYGGNLYTNNYLDLDTIHNLEIGNFDIKFGKYSKNGVMFFSEAGTVMDVGKSTETVHISGEGGLTTAFSDGINGNATNEDDASSNTIIAYSKGKWQNSYHNLYGSTTALEGKSSEINMYSALTMNSKEGIAYLAEDYGKVNVGTAGTPVDTVARQYKSIVAYAKDNGEITINGNVTATDDYLSGTHLSKADKSFNNVVAYAKQKNASSTDDTKITINGNVVVNGIGALADGEKTVVALNGINNVINTGSTGGLAAQNGGKVTFAGGMIVHKNNGTAVDPVTGAALTESDGSAKNDHKNVLPFYVDDRTTNGSTITFTGITDLKMSDGLLVYGNASDYDGGTTSATAKYLGMNKITVNLEGDNVNLGVYENLTPTWDGNDTTYLNTLKSVPKFAAINANGHKYSSTLTKGTLTVDTNVNLSDANDKFNYITMEREKVVINAGKTVTGNGKGLSMGSNSSSTSNSDTGYTNRGSVNITGGTVASGVAGINVAFGQILNDTMGTVTVDNGAGLYGTNGSDLTNDGTITVTGSGAGIFGASVGKKADGSNLAYGNEKITVTNNGAINVAGDNSVGLYANSNGSAAQTDVIVSNTKSLTLANNSVGIIVKGGNGGLINVTGTGNDDIKVGNNGIGIYGEKSKITLNSDYGIATGENGVGIYTDGTSKIIGAGKTLNYKYNGAAGTGVGMLYDGTNNVNGVNVVLNNAGNTADGLVGVFAKGSGTFTNTGNIDGTGVAGEIGIITENNDLNNSGTISLIGNPASLNNANAGIYAKTPNNIVNTGNITVGNNSIGIYGYGVNNNSSITTGDNGIGVFSQDRDVTLAGSVNVGNSESVAVFTTGTGQTINSTTDINIGDSSYGFVIRGNSTNATINDANGVTVGNDTVFVYSTDKTANITNYTNLTATGKNNYGIYTDGTTTNYGNIDFGASTGNVAIYASEGYAKNGDSLIKPVITVSGTDKTNPNDVYYGIGMAAGYENQRHGTIENFGIINVTQDNSIGMYASGNGSKAINRGDINLSGKKTTGMYLDNGAIGENYGTIRTVPNANNDGIIGVVAINNSIIKNYGHIIIDAPDSVGIYYKGGTIEEEGDIQASGDGSQRTRSAELTDTSKGVRGITINAAPLAGIATVTRAGQIAPITPIDTLVSSPTVEQVKVGNTVLNIADYITIPNVNLGGGSAELGMYVDTSGVNYTNPIEGLQYLTGLKKVNLILGIEAAKYTNAKDIEIGPNIIKPYNDAILAVVVAHGSEVRWQALSSSLTWLATPTQNPDQTISKIYLSKTPYQSFAKEQNTYNFLDGLEQRYGVEGKESREWQVFDKLNGIGKGETHIFVQAIDEMKGHQYANTQQRINATGNTLDKEFSYLRNEWRNPSKQNNKIKVFGARNEYKTDTIGIVDYKSNAYGVAYVHEDETVKLGHSSGWYAGAVTNRFKFKDLGKSREEQIMIKAGVFKMLSPKGDHNGSLRWTFGGDVFAGVNNMKRKFWVVDDTFEAKSDYYSYGAAFKTDLGYDIRMSERAHLRPYGALKMEYGRFDSIKEKSGQIRLEVESNDYFSVKPEVGLEFKYIQPLAVRIQLSIGVTAAYENELGKLQNGNRARVRYTTADWYNLEKEKEDRRGNGKFNLNIGLDNTRFGVTVNAGYDTKGENVRGGIGFRAIY